ncbi:2-oxoisovalerate dehydrogenase subunit beta [Candidatus Rhabdochlamydia oedothoracis]|uniref:2-oxoisovalerate dehydrogenase subunit beta n=1 Tax=Candidatus Rhabdochlamydia oedothoracis TaxID=2720720 RepID=A0ABX8V6A9_9BACT|nr:MULTISPECIES: pyruvate dehydrogenase complex E1 component subunit beta [Rhabdochlamydia]KAG6558774.1 2-oxoisovalerate dehydrogenase subunit beta [Candidatus Rhabdochlamydia sp. W815]MCL6755773.1 pyruvate dehydrogenase complex E1 component subunit beta [Candidatus Rhabdochlamydia oedothoracis]QYF48565.1 2-oxoisovalerate dehydrogenase subunit beta [Candidatus Rhabdochlamydia oedothoracis]
MSTQLTEMREALRQALDEEMQKDPRVFIIGEEVAEYNGAYKVTKGMLEKWGPDRVIDTPIAELGFSGLAIGAAMTGLKPVVEFMSFNFSFVAFDQIISNAIKMYYMSGNRFSVPIVFRGPNGAAAQVSSQHSHCVEALYANFPGLIVIAPSNPYDAKGLLKSAIRQNNPVLFLENELSYGDKMEIPTKEYLVPIGKARVVRKGNHVTLISHSRMVLLCEEAAKELQTRGIQVELIDLRTIKPLDIDTIATSVRKTHFCVLVEEGHIFGGISAEVGFQIIEHCFDDLDAPLVRVAQKETPMPYSKVLEKQTMPTKEQIIEAVQKVLA